VPGADFNRPRSTLAGLAPKAQTFDNSFVQRVVSEHYGFFAERNHVLDFLLSLSSEDGGMSLALQWKNSDRFANNDEKVLPGLRLTAANVNIPGFRRQILSDRLFLSRTTETF
jgi:hypothetical protein